MTKDAYAVGDNEVPYHYVLKDFAQMLRLGKRIVNSGT